MAENKKISENPRVTRGNIAGDDLVPIVDASAMVTSYATREDLIGSTNTVFNVRDYGATGDGVTDDGAEIQAAIDALVANDGGTLLIPPGTYTFATGLTLDPAGLTSMVEVRAYGAILNYTGSGHAFTIENNVTAVDDQDAEKSVHTYGLHIKGTSSADSGLRVKCCFGTFKDTVLENFTSVTSQQAALVLDALFLEWVEENTFDGLDIKNAGNGVCFISREDSGGAAASLMNNYFRNVHIWLKIDNGKGFYGVGLGASVTANIGRVIIDGAVIHPFEADGITCYDFTNCYSEGVVLISPSVDAYGTCNTLVAFDYNNAETMTIIGPTGFPLAEVDTYFDGGGSFNVIAGNFGGQTFLSRYTDMLDEDNMASNSATKVPTQQSTKAYVDAGDATKQPLDADLTTIAGLTATSDNFMQAKSGAWASRTLAQVRTDLGLTTREFWVLPASASAGVTAYGDYGVRGIGTTGELFFTFAVPNNFTAFSAVSVVGIPDATETIQFDIDTDYATVGQAHTTHTGTVANATVSTTANQLWEYDLKALLSSAVAGDIVGVRFQSDTDFIYVTGLRVQYT